MPLNKIQVRVQQIRYEAVDIISLLLVDPSGAELPEYLAGAHIDTHLPNGLIRQFSLCGPFSDKHSYLVGILKEDPGTGGSKFIHENIRAGDLLEISEPKNMFKLNSNAERHLLIGGGIGIAPILSMSYALEQQEAEYTLHYCSRSPEKTAFQKEIADVVQHGQLCFHFDGGIPENGLDIKAELRDHVEGTHLYCCGPEGMMSAVRDFSSHWPAGTVHFEYFSQDALPAKETDEVPEDSEFQIKLAGSGQVFTVPAHKTIVDVLRENGIFIETSCEDGFCGTCLTHYLEGEPDHRDEVLDDEDHEEYVLICCARSKSPELVLDL